MNQTSSQYHHGNLRETLIETTTQMLREGGIDSVSLRKLAERTGVSRAAPYHHFKDKNDLLAAVAEQGFEAMNRLLQTTLESSTPLQKRLEQSILEYLRFARENPTQYNLMFGHELWRKQPSQRLQRTARDSFRFYTHLFEVLQQEGKLAASQDPLRLAQLTWSTLHGLIKLAHDGIFAHWEDLEEISRYALVQVNALLDAQQSA